MKAMLICDHSLDPRLRKRLFWLKHIGYEVDVFTDSSRGSHFKDVQLNELDLCNLKKIDLSSYDLIYISGAKILISEFKFMFKAKIKNKKMIYEIPDLPLRSSINIINKITSLIFNVFVNFLFTKIVITSEGFLKLLPKNKDYFICENLPESTLIPLDVNENENENENERKIGFVGVLRYEDQMLFLIKYCIENNIEARFYGGPDITIHALKNKCKSLKLDIEGVIFFHGSFTQNDLNLIYNEIDFVYSVYDAIQPNVKLALPNKLYEAQLYKTPIIVANNTFLSEVVTDKKLGFSASSSNYSHFCLDMDIGLSKEYSISDQDVINKVNSSKDDFVDWISTC